MFNLLGRLLQVGMPLGVGAGLQSTLGTPHGAGLQSSRDMPLGGRLHRWVLAVGGRASTGEPAVCMQLR